MLSLWAEIGMHSLLCRLFSPGMFRSIFSSNPNTFEIEIETKQILIDDYRYIGYTQNTNRYNSDTSQILGCCISDGIFFN